MYNIPSNSHDKGQFRLGWKVVVTQIASLPCQTNLISLFAAVLFYVLLSALENLYSLVTVQPADL
jgi:hypothetical protein